MMKRYIYRTSIVAMSIPKDKMKKKMEARSDKLVEHIAKCVMYGDSLGINKYNHWIDHEIANWISEINDLTSKPDNKKLKPKFYEDILFGELGSSRSEAKANLSDLQLYNGKKSNPYPYVEIDNDMIDKMHEVSIAIVNKMVPLLASVNNLDKSDIEDILHNVMDPICLSD